MLNSFQKPHHPQAHPLEIQPPVSTSYANALCRGFTARHLLRKLAVGARSFSAMFPLSLRRISSLPCVSFATLTGDATYNSSKRCFPVRRRYVWLRIIDERDPEIEADKTHCTSKHPHVRFNIDVTSCQCFRWLYVFRCVEGSGRCRAS